VIIGPLYLFARLNRDVVAELERQTLRPKVDRYKAGDNHLEENPLLHEFLEFLLCHSHFEVPF
jgi:hypothetical protein